MVPETETETVQDRQQRESRPNKRNEKKRFGPLKGAAIVAIVIIAALFGFRSWQHAQRYEETDDAYVTGHSHPLSFRVNGTVSDVWIDDNKLVKQGQALAKLDPRDFEVQLHQADAGLQQSQAQLKQNEAQINQARAQLEQSRAQADASKAKFNDSQRLADRNRQLYYNKGGGVISQQDLDNSNFQLYQDKGTYESAEATARLPVRALRSFQTERGQMVVVASARMRGRPSAKWGS
jgi:membrane fusion protein, multidrug efflux system